MELVREHVRHDPKRLLAYGAGDLPATRFGDEGGARLVSELLVAGRDLGGEDRAWGVQPRSGDPELTGPAAAALDVRCQGTTASTVRTNAPTFRAFATAATASTIASAKRNVKAKTAITYSHSRLPDPTHSPFARFLYPER